MGFSRTNRYKVHISHVSHSYDKQRYTDMYIIYHEQTRHISFTVTQLSTLYKFLQECNIKGFRGTNNYVRINKDREYLYSWHLIALTQRVHIRIQALQHKTPVKLISLSLNAPEQMVLKAMLHRVDFGEEFELLITNKLKPHGKIN